MDLEDIQITSRFANLVFQHAGREMTIWSILIGGAAGFAFGGPIGALVGAAAAAYAESQITKKLNPEQSKKVAFTVAIIALSAKMARADGQVTASEIAAFRSKVDIAPEDVKRVGQFWDLARQTSEGFQAYAKQAVGLFGPQSAILEQLMDLLFTIARADGEIGNLEWDYLNEVASIFGYDEQGFERLSHLYSGKQPAPHLVLGIPSDADLETVKQAWKDMARKYHPDQLIAAGMPEEFIQVATDNLAAINAAYHIMSSQLKPVMTTP